ncbi:MAG: hypothetical protein ACTHK7_11480 [Aureliella sp.]
MRSPRVWFFMAICVLLPWHIALVARDPWFRLPPKPVGDGPDYENIAYQLSRGEGWSLDWTDPGWRAPYVNADGLAPRSNGLQQSDRGTYAVQLSRADGLAPTTGRPPLLPAIIAAIYWIVERGPVAFACVRLFLAACLAGAGAIACALSARLASSLTIKAWPVAVAAATTLALAMLDRTVRTYATDFLTEPLALLLVQLWLWCICELLGVFGDHVDEQPLATASPRMRALATLSGILLALLIFTRSIVVLWLPGVWLLLWAGSRFRRAAPAGVSTDAVIDRKHVQNRSVAIATRVIVVCVVLCAPWWARNCWVLKSWMPLGTQGPITLLGGYSDEALAHQGEWQPAAEERLRAQIENELVVYQDRSIPQRELRIARRASRLVRQWAAEHAADLPRLAIMRVVNEWNPYTGRALAWKLMALAGLCWLCASAPRAAWIFSGLLILNTLCAMALYSVGGRFLVPLYGMLYTLAGLGLAGLALGLHHLSLRSPRLRGRSPE